ncbi:hypothetical protein [Nitratiruptor tergarcus]|uniref:Uncharacterized protein n=1 Tax=Nitratiruptor tergarcus DSM 16512 TaxID=1069081 RepID=A0A1W1WQF0_9BACT|nr:hypothetical protein [Nitratiruptor tergarcus]SMC08435.1 hypothetical protein SAMN05660197_0187 [Nitratiruptor tergarcus DSM 16512]
MLVVIPVASINNQESLVCTIADAKSFAFVKLSESMQIENIQFKENFANEFFDYIVTPKKDDELDEAYELGARALLANNGMSIEDIIEAMMFRELDEIV